MLQPSIWHTVHNLGKVQWTPYWGLNFINSKFFYIFTFWSKSYSILIILVLVIFNSIQKITCLSATLIGLFTTLLCVIISRYLYKRTCSHSKFHEAIMNFKEDYCKHLLQKNRYLSTNVDLGNILNSRFHRSWTLGSDHQPKWFALSISLH